MPAPLDPHSYFHGRLVSPKDAVESKTMIIEKGWKLVPEWEPTDGAGTRPGFVKVPTLIAEDAGATLKFKFSGTAIGLFVAAGPDTGVAEFRVDNGVWRTQNFFTQWSQQLHLPWAKMLAPDLADGEHELELRGSNATDARSKGNAIRVVYFLVN